MGTTAMHLLVGPRSWMTELMRSPCTSLKRLEQELAGAQTPEQLCPCRATAS